LETTELTVMWCATSIARRTINSPIPRPSQRVESSRLNASKILDKLLLRDTEASIADIDGLGLFVQLIGTRQSIELFR
jgi:hypothetical protein